VLAWAQQYARIAYLGITFGWYIAGVLGRALHDAEYPTLPR
jgi:hypothetical protein